MSDARSRRCAGARRVALSTADRFAESPGQRNLEHQNEPRTGYSLFVAERPVGMLSRRPGRIVSVSCRRKRHEGDGVAGWLFASLTVAGWRDERREADDGRRTARRLASTAAS